MILQRSVPSFILALVFVAWVSLSTPGCFGSGSGDGNVPADPCEGVLCSGFGACVVANGEAVCTCNAGYHASGLECLADLCLEANCVHGHCTDPTNLPSCTCDTGYAGDTCEDCASGYVRDENGLECVSAGTGGPCDPSPCGHGDCSVENESAVCTCHDGYTGTICDRCAEGYEETAGECVAVSPCNPDPCVHGSCSEVNGLAVCDCEEEYEGSLCDRCAKGYIPQGLVCVAENAQDPCTPNPCEDEHRSVCTDDNGQASCVCDPGWHDESGACVEDVSCDPDSTCSGHGQCAETGLSCICDQGYIGEHCDTCDDGYGWESGACVVQTVDPCEPNPCTQEHRGVCRDQSGLAVCDCDAGYHLESDRCVADVFCNPDTTCSGHGDCSENGEECICDAGYAGTHCSQCDEGYTESGGICVGASTCPENHREVAGVCVADCDVSDDACSFAHASFGSLTSTNGFSAVVVDLDERKAVRMWEHIYKAWGEGVPTRDLLYDTYLGVRIDGEGTWLNTVPLDYAGYYEQEGIVHLVQQVRDIRVETMVYAPYRLDRPALVLLGKATNLGSVSHDVSLYSISNYRLGNVSEDDPTAPSVEGENLYWDAENGAYIEEGPIGALVHRPLGTVDHRGTGGPYDESNPWRRLSAGQDLGDENASQGDDRTCGFQKSFSLAPGNSGWLGSVSAYEMFEGPSGMLSQLETAYGTQSPEDVLDQAVEEWEAWRTPAPESLSAAETTVYRVSEAILRMGQVREPNNEDSTGDGFHKPYGQILAALPPGNWNISWIRDMSYAIAAMVDSGHYDEARAALEFVLKADSGNYSSYVGEDYQVSVCRYYGRGREETDFNADGPNIEFDGFGLFLWVLGMYVSVTEDWDFLDLYWETVRDGISEPLYSLIDTNGMIAADSSIWEVHWNGQQKQYIYTSLSAAQGLLLATFLADRAGDTDLSDRYFVITSFISGGIENNAMDEGFLAQSVEEYASGSGYVDAAVVEAFNWYVFDPTSSVAETTLARFDSDLRVSHGRGYFRNDDGGAYDSKEWVFIDLRIAAALRRAGRVEDADALTDWITAQAINNMGLIAELHDPSTAAYDGAVPMVGFGAGAYLMNLWLRDRLSGARDLSQTPEGR